MRLSVYFCVSNLITQKAWCIHVFTKSNKCKINVRSMMMIMMMIIQYDDDHNLISDDLKLTSQHKSADHLIPSNCVKVHHLEKHFSIFFSKWKYMAWIIYMKVHHLGKKIIWNGYVWKSITWEPFLVSQDALEVTVWLTDWLTKLLTPSELVLPWVMRPYWVMIPEEDFTDVTLVHEDVF